MQTDNKKIWCVIPVYNNGKTLKEVVLGCKKFLNNILVVDDGSTDIDVYELLQKINVNIIQHKNNIGKGKAIKTAINYLNKINADYMITIDADGQHYPADLPKFISVIQKNNHTLVIGSRDFSSENIPDGSKFGRNFSNIWVRLETGLNLSDTQSGYRAYPVKYISRLKFITNAYNFEIEILVKSSWAGITIKEVPIDVHYPIPEERVSHFNTILDNIRISLIHVYLLTLRILPVSYKKLIKDTENEIDYKLIFHPIKLFKFLLKEHSTPKDLALAASVGTFLAILPLVGFHSVAIIYTAVRLRLNKIMAFNIQHLFMPPFTPVICVEVGHYMLNGKWFTDISFQTLCVQLPERILEWLIGSLALAPVLAVIMGFIVYVICKWIKLFGSLKWKFKNGK